MLGKQFLWKGEIAGLKFIVKLMEVDGWLKLELRGQ